MTLRKQHFPDTSRLMQYSCIKIVSACTIHAKVQTRQNTKAAEMVQW